MRGKRADVLVGASALASLVLAVGVSTVFGACGMKEDGTWMHCHDVQMALAACAAAITVVLAVATFAKSKAVRRFLCALAIIGCVAVIVLPDFAMPMCMVATMRCHEMMAPFARFMAVIVGALCVANIARSR